MKSIYIVAAKRTPIGSFNGALSSVSAPDLGAIAIRGALNQSAIDPQIIDEVIVGNVLSSGIGMGPGRQASIKAGIPETTPAYTLNMICGSGMKTVMDAASHIRSDDADIVIAAGMENMSQAPFIQSHKIRSGIRMGEIKVEDSIIVDGLTDAFHQYHMGITAENIATHLSISREEQDNFALQSQQKSAIALNTHRLKSEIEPVPVTQRHKTVIVDTDEYPKADTTIESLAKLRPAFKKEGTVTAGNASGINDGASALILSSKKAVDSHHLTPIAEIVSYAQTGLSPKLMGLGPVEAIKKALTKAKLSFTDINCFELNEAFAAQALGVIKQLSDHYNIDPKWIHDRTNHNGGAIALGHPLGASGNRILVSLLYELERQNQEYGLASLCVGGGMGTAIIIRRISNN